MTPDIQTEDFEIGKFKSLRTKITTVRVEGATRKWLAENNIHLSGMVRFAPIWKDRMDSLLGENRDLKTGNERKDLLIMKLNAENAELLRFKNRVQEQLRQRKDIRPEGLFG